MYFQVTWHRLFSPCKQTSKNTSASAHQHKHLQQHIESDFYIWLPCNLLISTCCLINYYFFFFVKSIKNLCLGNCFYFYFFLFRQVVGCQQLGVFFFLFVSAVDIYIFCQYTRYCTKEEALQRSRRTYFHDNETEKCRTGNPALGGHTDCE